jgi:hypothetical protein
MAQQLNLFDPSLRPEQRWLRASTAVTLLLVLGLLLWAGSVALGQAARALERRAQRADAELSQLSAALRATPDGAQEQALEQMRQQLAQTQQWQIQMQTLPPAQAAQALLEALANAASEEVWLTQMRWQAKDSQLALEGRLLDAKRLPPYLRSLEAQPALRGQSFLQVQLRPPSAVAGAAPEKDAASHFQLQSSPQSP